MQNFQKRFLFKFQEKNRVTAHIKKHGSFQKKLRQIF